MKKKILLALCLVAIASLLFAISANAAEAVKTWDVSAKSEDSVTAYLYNDSENSGFYTLTISGIGKMKGSTYSSDKPWVSYEDKITSVTVCEGVTNIGAHAFDNCQKIKEISLPSTLEQIDDYAFYLCESLTSVNIPYGVTLLKGSAFACCYGLVEVTIPDSVVTMGERVFFGCESLKSIVIPEGVTVIEKETFMSCSSLASVTIKGAITSIEESAFGYCKSLVSLRVPESVTFIGRTAFKYCTGLKRINMPKGVRLNVNPFDQCSESLTIYCEDEKQLEQWGGSWNRVETNSNPSKIKYTRVVWDYKNTIKKDVFTFKGYSFGFAGQISCGFDIDNKALELYRELAGVELQIGVVFAGYDNLGGKQPLDNKGEAISTELGRVIKGDISAFDYKSYDFVLNGVTEDIRDVKLVMAGYIFDGEVVKYVQSNGISDTVIGVSYNEAKNG